MLCVCNADKKLFKNNNVTAQNMHHFEGREALSAFGMETVDFR